MDMVTPSATIAGMAKRKTRRKHIQKPGRYRPTKLRDWRKMRHLTQEQLAARIDSTAATISRLENGKQPYSQGILEALATALDIEPADILAGPPPPEQVEWLDLYRKFGPEEIRRVFVVVRAMAA